MSDYCRSFARSSTARDESQKGEKVTAAIRYNWWAPGLYGGFNTKPGLQNSLLSIIPRESYRQESFPQSLNRACQVFLIFPLQHVIQSSWVESWMVFEALLTESLLLPPNAS